MVYNKNITVIFLLLLVTVPLLFGVYTFVQQGMIQYQMKEKLESEYLQSFTIQDSKVIWLRKDKEILLDGKLFDVKKVIKKDRWLRISGLFDQMEDEFFDQIKKHNDPVKNSSSCNAALLLLLSTYDLPNEFKLNRFYFIPALPKIFFNSENISLLYYEIIVPPPKMA